MNLYKKWLNEWKYWSLFEVSRLIYVSSSLVSLLVLMIWLTVTNSQYTRHMLMVWKRDKPSKSKTGTWKSFNFRKLFLCLSRQVAWKYWIELEWKTDRRRCLWLENPNKWLWKPKKLYEDLRETWKIWKKTSFWLCTCLEIGWFVGTEWICRKWMKILKMNEFVEIEWVSRKTEWFY